MHKKYIKKGGKTFGPYLYETRRENGKVVTKYVGKPKRIHEFKETKSKLTYKIPLTFVLIVSVILFLGLISSVIVDVSFNNEEKEDTKNIDSQKGLEEEPIQESPGGQGDSGQGGPVDDDGGSESQQASGGTIPISECMSISSSGNYVLVSPITNHDGDCFIITASDVIFEGNGLEVGGDGDSTGIGMAISNANNVKIRGFNLNGFFIGIELSSVTNTNISENNIHSNIWNVLMQGTTFQNTFRNNNLSLSLLESIIDQTIGLNHNYIVYNDSYTELRWTDETFAADLSLTGNLQNPGNVVIAQRSAFFDPTTVTDTLIDSSANITFFNVPNLDDPELLRDGSRCGSSCTEIFTPLDNGDVKFEVIGFSNYTLGGDPVENIIDDCGYTIENPGTYVLLNNLHTNIPIDGEDCIDIHVDDVTIDGRGFTITGLRDDPLGTRNGIQESSNSRGNVTIKNIIVSNFSTGIRFTGPGTPWMNASIINVTVNDSDTGIRFSTVVNALVVNSSIVDDNEYGIHIYSFSSNVTVLNSNVSRNRINNIYVDDSANINLENNTINSCLDHSIQTECKGLLLFRDVLPPTVNNTIVNNRFFGNYEGVSFVEVENTSLVGNVFYENDLNGISLENSDDNNISRNNVSGCLDLLCTGILLQSSSDRNNLNNNIVQGNENGIVLYFGVLGSILDNNNVTFNDIGLWLNPSNGFIFNNLFRNNNIHNNALHSILDESRLTSVNYLKYDNEHGEIMWTDDTSQGTFLTNLDVDGDMAFSDGGTIRISHNHAEVKTAVFPLGNIYSEANVTLSGNPGQGQGLELLRDGIPCGNDCTLFTLLTDPIVRFNVSDFSIYTVGSSGASCPGLVTSDFTLTEDLVGTGDCIIAGADNIVIDGNGYTISGDGDQNDIGISLDSDNCPGPTCNSITVRNFNIDNFGHGIRTGLTVDSIIENNNMTNVYQGIEVNVADNNEFYNNSIENCVDDGFFITFSDFNRIHNSNITNCDNGMSFQQSESNFIDHNNIFDNNVGLFLSVSVSLNTFLNNNISNSGSEILDFSSQGIYNYLVYNNSEGEIKWATGDPAFMSGDLTIDGDLIFPGSITITNNHAEVDEGAFTVGRFDTEANITLHDVQGFGNPKIQRDGLDCPDTDCRLFSYDGSSTIFNVSGFTVYSIVDQIDLVPPSISYIEPTPSDGVIFAGHSFFVNMSSSDDLGEHYTFLDIDNTNTLWMKMDTLEGNGDVTDSSSYSDHGEVGGNAQQSLGYYDSSFLFGGSGSGDFINLTAGAIPKNKGTLAGWIRLNDIVDNPIIFYASDGESENRYNGYGDGASQLEITLGVLNSGILRFAYQDGSETGGGYVTILGDSHGPLNLDQWYHVAATFDDESLARLYIDGTEVSSVDMSAQVFSGFPVVNSYISRSGWTPGNRNFDGWIDEVLIFSRALNGTEIESLYDASQTQYDNDFSSLSSGSHTFTGYANDRGGNSVQTSSRTIVFDNVDPLLSFVSPTPADSETVVGQDFQINIQSSDDLIDHYTYLELDDDLALCLRMDDIVDTTVQDICAGSDGTLVGGTRISEYGAFGRSAEFNRQAGNEHIAVTDNSGLTTLPENYQFSISFWAENNVDVNAAAAITFSGADDLVIYPYSTVSPAGTRVFWRDHGGNVIHAGHSLSQTGFHHFVYVVDGWDNHSLYIDGVLVFQNVSVVPGTPGPFNNFFIGMFENSQYFGGSIDEVLIFKRPLKQEEVQSLYSANVNQYQSNFNRPLGGHSFTGYAVDKSANIVQTETRNINLVSGTNIDSCRTLDQEDTVYTLDSDINIDVVGSCITIGANNITLDLGDNSIIDSVQAAFDYGVLIDGYNNTKIQNGEIIGFNNGIRSIDAYNGTFNDLVVFSEGGFPGDFYGVSMYMEGGENNTIRDNIITMDLDSGAVFIVRSLFIFGSDHNLIENNVINNSDGGDFPGDALFLDNSNNNYIINNKLVGQTQHGMYFQAGSNNNYIGSNLVKYGNGIGIRIDGNDNLMIDNVVNETMEGVEVRGNRNTLINSTIFNVSTNAIDSNFVFRLKVINSSITKTGLDAFLLSNGINTHIENLIIREANDDAISMSGINNDGFGNITFKNITVLDSNVSFYDFRIATDHFGIHLIDSYIENYSIENSFVEVESTGIGKTRYLQRINGNGLNLSHEIRFEEIGNDPIAIVEIEDNIGLNKSANVTLYGVPTNFLDPKILRDGVNCPEEVCTELTSLNAGTVVFNVTSWSEYQIGEVFIDISWEPSSNLSDGIQWNITTSGVNDVPANGNGDIGEDTWYNITITSIGTPIDVYTRADGNLISQSSDEIDISNEKFSYSLTDPTVPGGFTPLTLDYNDNQIGSSLREGEHTIYLEYFLSIPIGQPAGTYSNNVEFAIVPEGEIP